MDGSDSLSWVYIGIPPCLPEAARGHRHRQTPPLDGGSEGKVLFWAENNGFLCFPILPTKTTVKGRGVSSLGHDPSACPSNGRSCLRQSFPVVLFYRSLLSSLPYQLARHRSELSIYSSQQCWPMIHRHQHAGYPYWNTSGPSGDAC